MPLEIDVLSQRLGPTTAGIGWVRSQTCVNVVLPGVGATAVVTADAAGFKRILEAATAYVSAVGVGAGATRDLRVLKNGAIVVAVGTLTLANTTPAGAAIALAVTDANAEFLDGDTFTIDFPAGGTAFTGGVVNLVLKFRTRPQTVA